MESETGVIRHRIQIALVLLNFWRQTYCNLNGSWKLSDLSQLSGVTTLATLNVMGTKITAASVAALQKALSNCKIEWDDPAKPKTPAPAASGSQ